MNNTFTKLFVAVLLVGAPLSMVAGCGKKGKCKTTKKKKAKKGCNGSSCRR